jgi:hypothetical protein
MTTLILLLDAILLTLLIGVVRTSKLPKPGKVTGFKTSKVVEWKLKLPRNLIIESSLSIEL